MNNLVRCSLCGNLLIYEELSIHVCRSNPKTETIEYIWLVSSEIEGIGNVVMIKSNDGTLFTAIPTKTERSNFFTKKTKDGAES